MINPIILLLSFLALCLNLDTPSNLSNTSSMMLIGEYFLVVCLAFVLTRKFLPTHSKDIQKRYFNAFLIGLIIALVIMPYTWTPWLNPNYDGWGFDSQRYYTWAKDYIFYDDLSFMLNGVGVVYFYIFFMEIFGVDPLVPLFINSIFCYFAILQVANYIGKDNYAFLRYGWLLCLIPELIYFNMMPSRDILCMAFLTTCVVHLGTITEKKSKIIALVSFILLFVIRPTMALPLIICVILNNLFFGKGGKKNYLYLIVIIGVVVLMSSVGGLMSSENDLSLSDRVSQAADTTGDLADGATGGLTNFLTPHNPIEYVVFGSIRSFLYLFITPDMIISPIDSFSVLGEGQAPGLPNITTLLMFLSIPAMLRLLRHKDYKIDKLRMIFITFCTYFFVVGIFNPHMIHIRYRVVYDVLFFTLVLYEKKSIIYNKR